MESWGREVIFRFIVIKAEEQILHHLIEEDPRYVVVTYMALLSVAAANSVMQEVNDCSVFV